MGMNMDASGSIAHAAFVHGFGRVLLYGAIGVWVMAALSFVIFGTGKPQKDRLIHQSKTF
jgi:hypothetical protein